MFKKSSVVLLCFGLVFVLAACGSTSQAAETQQATPGMVEIDSATMTEDMRLVLGTLKLEDTELAVDKEEAAVLLPLWKAVRVLKSDDTISTQEMDALYQQIRDSMSTEQVKAINAMAFSDKDINTLIASLGVGFGTMAEGEEGSGQMMQGMRQIPSGGGFPSGDGPSGGGAPPGDFQGGGEMRIEGGAGFEGMPAMEGEVTTEETSRSAGNRMLDMLIEPLIRLLKERAAS